MADYREIARADAVAAGVPPEMFVRQIQQESGFRTHDANGNILTSSGGAIGIAQIIPRWHPTVDPTDPVAALAYAAALMAGHRRRFGSWKKALAAFNWGPGNVSGYTKPDGTVVPPWDGRRETISDQGRHYLDTILGPGWPEPTGIINDGGGPSTAMPNPWMRTQLTNGSAVSTPEEWPTVNPRKIRSLVWHTMQGWLAGAISTWNLGGASAHLCVLRDGTIVRTVDIENIAWHAGTNATTGRNAFWKANNINPVSIGIELEGFVASGFTQEQIAACVRIGQWALATYGIKPVRGGDSLDGHHLHSEVSNQRSDPGALFPFDAILSAIEEAPVVVPDAPSPFSVGSGILESMRARGDSPASDELYYPAGGKSQYSEAIGRSGAVYRYIFATNATHRYDPAA